MACKYKTYSFVCVLLASAFLLPCTAGAADACKEAKELKKQRFLFDAEMRIKRSDLNGKTLEIKRQMNEMDREMAGIEKEFANLEGPKRKELIAKYEALSERRDAIIGGIYPIQKEYSETLAKRTEGRLEFKKQELKKRYECVLNEDLSRKLAVFLEGHGKRNGEKERAEIAALVKGRAEKVESLKKEYVALNAALDEKLNAYQKLNDTFRIVLQREEEYDKLVDKQVEEIYGQFDKTAEALDKYGDEIAAISEKLIPYTD